MNREYNGIFEYYMHHRGKTLHVLAQKVGLSYCIIYATLEKDTNLWNSLRGPEGKVCNLSLSDDWIVEKDENVIREKYPEHFI